MRTFTYVKDGQFDENGRMIPAYGLSHDDIFVTDAFKSDCGRFEVEPSMYGLTMAEAIHLRALNEGLLEAFREGRKSGAAEVRSQSVLRQWVSVAYYNAVEGGSGSTRMWLDEVPKFIEERPGRHIRAITDLNPSMPRQPG